METSACYQRRWGEGVGRCKTARDRRNPPDESRGTNWGSRGGSDAPWICARTFPKGARRPTAVRPNNPAMSQEKRRASVRPRTTTKKNPIQNPKKVDESRRKTAAWKLESVRWKAVLFCDWKWYIKSSCSRLATTWRAAANGRPSRVVKLYCDVVNFHKQQRIYDPVLEGEMGGGLGEGRGRSPSGAILPREEGFQSSTVISLICSLPRLASS